MLKHRNIENFKAFLNTGKGRLSLIAAIAVVMLLLAILPGMLTFGVTDRERNLAAAIVDLSRAENKTITGSAGLQLGGVQADIDLKASAKTIEQTRGELAIKATIGANTFNIPVEFVYNQAEKEQYYKLSNLDGLLEVALNPEAPVAAQIEDLAKKLDGNWLRLSADNVKGLTDSAPAADIDECTPQLLSKIQTHPAAQAAIAEVLASDSLFAIDKVSNVSGGEQYHIKIQSEEADKAISTLKKTELFKAADKCEQNYDPFKLQARSEAEQASPQPTNPNSAKPAVELKVTLNKKNQMTAFEYSSKAPTQVMTADIQIASDQNVAVATPKSDIVDYSSVSGQFESIFKVLSTPPAASQPGSNLVQPYGR